MGAAALAMGGMGEALMVGGMGIGLLIVLILAIIIGLIIPIAYIRFSRTDSIGEAFNFNAIFGHIGKNWLD